MTITSALRLSLAGLLAFPASAWANPVGGVVAGGAAVIGSAGGTLTVDQSTEHAIIDWNSFSIAGGETTVFNLPSQTSAVLNRVTGAFSSDISGTLSSNGNVFLINPNGVLVGATGVVNTQGFVASTLDLNNADFMLATDLNFTGGSANAVQNDGAITAGGDVLLIARSVVNNGTIDAPNGTAALAAGSDVLYKPLDEERVFVQAGLGSTAVGVDNTLTGGIQAAAVELKAAGGNVYALAINNAGTINADEVATVGGRIYLTATGGAVANSGGLTTTKAAGAGDVLLTGDRITLEGASSIAAADLRLTAGSEIRLDADVTTAGSQTYDGPVVLGANRTLTSTAGDITFNGTVDSLDAAAVSQEFGLAANAGGLVSFNGAVGSLFALGNLDASAAAVGLNAGVTTAGYQTYLGSVDVGADAVLTAGGYVYFGGTVDSANLSALTVSAVNSIDFVGAVGATALGGLSAATTPGGAGYIWFQSSLDSDGAVVINSDFTTDVDGAVGARALGGLTATGADYLWFYNTFDSDANAVISLTSPDVGFVGAVGGTSLGALTVDAGYITFQSTLDNGAASAVSLTGSLDIIFGGAVGSVSLGGLTVDGAHVAFQGSLDSDGGASVTASNRADFNAPVGARALDSLSVTAVPGISFNGGSVATSGAQTYSGPASFGAPGQFTSAGGAITFLDLVDTSGLDLTVDAGAGAVTFGGAVTAGNLTVAGGDVRWDGSLSAADVLISGENLIMNGDVNSTGPNGAVLVAGTSFDNASASAINASTRWLVYADAPASVAAGGLAGDTEEGTAYPDAPAFAGSGFVYADVSAVATEDAISSELDSVEAAMVPPSVDDSSGGDLVADAGSDDPVFGDASSGGSGSEDSGSGDSEDDKDGDK